MDQVEFSDILPCIGDDFDNLDRVTDILILLGRYLGFAD